MNRTLIVLAFAATASLVFSIAGCGDGDTSSQDAGPDGGGIAAPELKIISFDLSESAGAKAAGDSGSEVVSLKYRIRSFEVQKDDGEYVSVYDGDEYLELVGTGQGTVAASLVGIMPDPGVYKGYKCAVTGMMIKAKIDLDGTIYYTTAQKLSSFTVPWTMSNSEADWGPVTIEGVDPMVRAGDFYVDFVVDSENPADIVWVFERDYGIVSYEGTGPDDITNIAPYEMASAVLPGKPEKKADISITAIKLSEPDKTNRISLFYDESGAFIGSSHSKTLNAWYFNGASVIAAQVTGISNNGDAGHFNLSVAEADHPDVDFYVVTGDYDCATGDYSNVAVIPDGATLPPDETYSLLTDSDGTAYDGQLVAWTSYSF